MKLVKRCYQISYTVMYIICIFLMVQKDISHVYIVCSLKYPHIGLQKNAVLCLLTVSSGHCWM